MVNMVDMHPRGVSIATSRESFAKANGVFAIPLNLPDEGVRAKTGLSTSGTAGNFDFSAQGLVATAKDLGVSGSFTSYNLYVLAECTSELRIMPGRQMSLVS